jgi:hypothetical protein
MMTTTTMVTGHARNRDGQEGGNVIAIPFQMMRDIAIVEREDTDPVRRTTGGGHDRERDGSTGIGVAPLS